MPSWLKESNLPKEGTHPESIISTGASQDQPELVIRSSKEGKTTRRTDQRGEGGGGREKGREREVEEGS